MFQSDKLTNQKIKSNALNESNALNPERRLSSSMQITLPLFVNNWTKGGEDGRETLRSSSSPGSLGVRALVA